MKRRDFLKRATPMLAVPFLVNGLPIRAFARTKDLDDFINVLGATDKVLVLVQLGGGNDGINTCVPLDQLSVYNSVRSSVALPEAKLLKLTDSLAFHPAMTDMQKMFSDQKLGVVQGVTYPNPNLSHFRSTDIWMSGTDYNQYLSTGWTGRYLNTEYPGYPSGYPNATMPDPPAIQMGPIMSLAIQGPGQSMGIAIQDPTTFYNLVNGTKSGPFAPPPDTRPGNELKFLRQVEVESQQYSTTIKAAADKAQNKVTYPTQAQNALAAQLAIVARLIAGGLKTRVYVVSLSGFDTHAAQVDSADKTVGAHATLLSKLSNAMGLFYEDLKQLGVDQRVLSMTFSEFGRRVESNASLGTDHGTAAPLFVFGTSVNPIIHGANPSLTNLDNGNLRMNFDFRQIYTSVLAQWFGVDNAGLKTAMLKDFNQIPIIKQTPSFVGESSQDATLKLAASPNPVNGTPSTISYQLTSDAEVRLRVLDLDGREITSLVNEYQQSGEHSASLNASRLANGTYFCELRAGKRRDVLSIVVQH